MNTNQNELRLLPGYFKKIAWGLLATVLLIIVLRLTNILQIEKAIVKAAIENTVLPALLLLALTQDKVEDELTMRLRAGAFAGSFIFGVAFFIATPFVNLIFVGSFMSDTGVFQLLLTMFFFYFIIFYLAKKNR